MIVMIFLTQNNFLNGPEISDRLLGFYPKYLLPFFLLLLASEKKVPPCEPRIPQHQLLLEMAAMIKQHMRLHMQTDIRTVIKPAPKFSPAYHGGNTMSVPHTEIILYEDDTQERESIATAMRQ